MPPFAIRGHRILTPAGVAPGVVYVRDGRIEWVDHRSLDVPEDLRVVDAHDAIVMPGLVDTHVHINEPGRTDWEGFRTATLAAAAGGVTTVLDMPLNSIPATTAPDALRVKVGAAAHQCAVDVGFIGGIVPGNAEHIRALHAAGVSAFKCFLVTSGVDEFPPVDEGDLRSALPELAALGTVLMVHAELPGPLAAAPPPAGASYAAYLASRPAAAEHEAIALVLALADELGARVHIVHLSSADSLPAIRAARARGVSVTVETCPHYLFFAAETIPDGATEFKCAPPIRGRANREALWDALVAGDIDMIVSDHSPCPPALKRHDAGDFATAWGGIASLQLGLPVIWQAMRERRLPLERIAGWMSEAPARLAGLGHRKGRIAPGYDADLVIWNPDAMFVVEPDLLYHRHALTPYTGHQLHGVVEMTFVRGHRVYEHGVPRRQPVGRLLVPAGSVPAATPAETPPPADGPVARRAPTVQLPYPSTG